MIKCFELIDVKLAGEQIQARPVAWDREIYDGFGNDRNGEPAVPTEFEGTCPHCGNLVHFSQEDIYKDRNNDDNVRCRECGAGAKSVTKEEKIEAVSIKLPSFEPRKESFVDPISSGLFDVDVDLELLERIESAESD